MDCLDRIILFLSCIFEVYICYDFFYAYFDFRDSFICRWRRALVCVIAAIVLFFVNILGSSYINLIGIVIITWLELITIFKADIGTRIIWFLTAIFTVVGCEFLFGIFLYVPAYIQKKSMVVNLSDIPWHIFTMKLLTYIILSVVKQCFGKSKKRMDGKLYVSYLCIPVTSFGMMLLVYYTSADISITIGARVLYSLMFVFMLMGNIFIFRAFNKYSEELFNSAEQKMIISRQNMDLQYYSQIQLMDGKHKEFIHNISHHLKTIGELAKDKDTNSIISVLQDLNIELENNSLSIYCSNPVVNSVLSEKKSIADKEKIDLDIYVEPGVTFKGISDADIITMLSNLMDNALRAAETAQKKEVAVRIYVENEGCFHVIKIQNYFAGALIKNASGFETTKSTGELHGIGIKSVKRTAEKYHGYLECFIEGQQFTAVLLLRIQR